MGSRFNALRHAWSHYVSPASQQQLEQPKPNSAHLRCEAGDQVVAEISFVNRINQTNHSTNQERPCTTIQRIEKELSICQSYLCPDLVRFPVLSQIKPHTPRLVVLLRQFLQVSALRMYSPLNPKTLISRFRGADAEGYVNEKSPDPESASFTVWTTTVSDHLRSPHSRS